MAKRPLAAVEAGTSAAVLGADTSAAVPGAGTSAAVPQTPHLGNMRMSDEM